MIDVRFILINKLIFLAIILIFFTTILILIRFFNKKLSITGVKGTIKLCLIGLLLLFFEAELSNIFFYGKLVKKLQEIIAIICSANFISYIVIHLFLYYRMKKDVPSIIRDAINLLIYIIFAMASLKIIFNIEVSSIITTSAVLTAAIAFAMQNTLSNVISGFSVQIDKNLKKDTWINIKDRNITGQIENVGFRYTVLKTLENEKIIVPNNIMLQNVLLSYGKKEDDDACALSVNVGFSYEVPPLKAKEILLKILKSHPDIVKTPEPVVYTANFSDNYMDMRMRFFVNDFAKKDRIRDDILTQAWYSIIRAGYSIPYPHREIIQKKSAKIFNLDLEETKRLLKNVDIFSLLKENEIAEIVNNAFYRVFANGEVIVNQGEDGDSLFFVLSGELSVLVNNAAVASIEKSEVFGEMSLLTGEKRKATVIAKTEAHLLEITKEIINPFIQKGDFLNALASLIVERQMENVSTIKTKESEILFNTKKQDYLSKLRSFFGIK